MKRTTILADESTLLEIKQLAEEQEQSVSDVIREALSEYVATRRKPERGHISFIGAGRSGRTDISERAEEILQDAVKPHEGWE
ncbi:MAG: CopG family transcriptional regulator [Chloroflexi bacterium]|nr:CopG family transcriptional regulator [Chloroflexota bacterium]